MVTYKIIYSINSSNHTITHIKMPQNIPFFLSYLPSLKSHSLSLPLILSLSPCPHPSLSGPFHFPDATLSLSLFRCTPSRHPSLRSRLLSCHFPSLWIHSVDSAPLTLHALSISLRREILPPPVPFLRVKT
jgi:hypothetical protein